MAQDFERNIARNVGTSASTIFTADSDDAVVGINVANVTTSQIKVSVFVTVSSNDHFLVKDAPIPPQSTLKIVSGQKVVLNSDDKVLVYGSAASLDVVASILEDVT